MSEKVFRYVESFRRNNPRELAEDVQEALDDFDDNDEGDVMTGHEIYYSTAMTQDDMELPVWWCSVLLIIFYKQK